MKDTRFTRLTPMPIPSHTPFDVLPLDTALTVENARRRGYTFVCDMLPAFVEENKDLLKSLADAGCVSGLPSVRAPDEAMGLYQRLTKPNGAAVKAG